MVLRRSMTLALLAALAGCQTAPVAPPAQRLVALGTEPFWSIAVESGTLTWSSPENQSGTLFKASTRQDGTAMVYAGTLAGQPLTLRIVPGTCSDGMSDQVYPYSATVTQPSGTLKGCARLAAR